MKKIIILLCFLLIYDSLFAQNVSFEGKSYPQGQTEEHLVDSLSSVVKIIKVEGDQIEVYKKTTTKWGIVSFTMNNIPITEIIYESKTKKKDVNIVTATLKSSNSLKALYIFNFNKFIEWPESAKNYSPVGVLSTKTDSPEIIQSLRNRFESVKIFKTLSEISNVRILFIPEEESFLIKLAELSVANKPTLIVTEFPHGNYCMINFIISNDNLKFQLNPDKTEAVGLKIGSNLFSVSQLTGSKSFMNELGSNKKTEKEWEMAMSELLSEMDTQKKTVEIQNVKLDVQEKALNEKEFALKELLIRTSEQEKMVITRNILLQKQKNKLDSQKVNLKNIASTKEILMYEVQKRKLELNESIEKIKKQKKILGEQFEEISAQKRNLYLSFLVILLIAGMTGIVFRSLKQRNKQNKIITEQKIIVEVKQKEILDSIEYALRIQTAILPPQKIVKQYLEDSFILYKPKDIVAGDFYWMETFNDIVLFAACDCTGHGVPGAMVSVVCHNALNRAVREFGLNQPAAILDKTAEIVIENFAKSEEDIKDGMDISLCALNTRTKTIQWAGANNALWLIQNNELIETKANKQPIGMNEHSKPFTNHTFTLSAGDSIYLFTDGFADQFGGEKGDKKLTRKRFKELLIGIQDKSMHEQGGSLDKFIVNYRKGVEQIDDILVMGVKV